MTAQEAQLNSSDAVSEPPQRRRRVHIETRHPQQSGGSSITFEESLSMASRVTEVMTNQAVPEQRGSVFTVGMGSTSTHTSQAGLYHPVFITSTTTPGPECPPPPRLPTLGLSLVVPQLTGVWHVPKVVPQGMPDYITRARTVVETYHARQMTDSAMFARMAQLMGLVKVEIRSSGEQSFATVFDQMGGNRLIDHVMSSSERSSVALNSAILMIAANINEVLPSSPIPARISQGFCIAQMAELRRIISQYRIPYWTTSGDTHYLYFAAGWQKICPELVRSPNVARRILVHGIRKYQREICSSGSCRGLFISTPRSQILVHARSILGSFNSLHPDRLLAGVAAVSLQETGHGPGVVRDWFTTLAIQMFGSSGVFERSESVPHYTRISSRFDSRMYLADYKMSGRFMALSIIQGVPIGVNFPHFYYSAMLDQPATMEEIRSDDPELYRSFQMISGMSAEDLGDIGVGLTGSGFEDTPLNIENRMDQINARLARMLLAPSDVSAQMAAIKQGFFEVLPRSIFEGFSPSQLRGFIVGDEAIDVDDLRRNFRVDRPIGSSYNRDSEQVVWFMEMMDDLRESDRRKVLRWITGSSQIPLGGFANLLPQPLLITPMEGGEEGFLPRAHTCFNHIELPRYPSKEILLQKIMQAIEYVEMGIA